jgi:hypothetical protein
MLLSENISRDRRSAIEFHLRNVERLLMPTKTTNVLMTTMKMSNANNAAAAQPQSSPSDIPPSDMKSFFNHLVKILEGRLCIR